MNSKFRFHQEVIHPDFIDTWPFEILDFITESSIDWDSDSGTFNEDINRELLKLLKNRKIYAHHASRLFQTEINEIRSFGLKPLSKELAMLKIELLPHNIEITENQVERLKEIANNELEVSENRLGNIPLVVGESRLSEYNCGSSAFQELWGGEFLYINLSKSDPIRNMLRIGTPSLVRVHVEAEPLFHNGFDIAKVFLGTYLGDKYCATSYLKSSDQLEICKVLTPADEEYRNLACLLTK